MLEERLNMVVCAKSSGVGAMLEALEGPMSLLTEARRHLEDALEKLASDEAAASPCPPVSGMDVLVEACAQSKDAAKAPSGPRGGSEKCAAPSLLHPELLSAMPSSAPLFQNGDLGADFLKAAAQFWGSEHKGAGAAQGSVHKRTNEKAKGPKKPLVTPQIATFLRRFKKYLEQHHVSLHTKTRLSPFTVQNRINHVRHVGNRFDG